MLFLNAPFLVESVLASLMEPIDNQDAHICVSIDAEWNISRHVGVSIVQIAPHSQPDSIYIIPVSHSVTSLEPRLLIHDYIEF